jgi:squalene-hopene/tetraprenyl-beta-curcumene cyclase
MKHFFQLARILVLGLLSGCGAPAPPPPLSTAAPTAPDERPLARAVRYLVRRQATDGAWRSDTYGTFKDGTALTPLVLHALEGLPADLRPTAACDRAAAYLAAMARPDATILAPPHGFDYPLYTAALAVTILSHPRHTAHRAARDVWLIYLRERQLTERLGWSRDDAEYGGWGYCRTLPRKPTPGAFAPPLIESNLSATRYAVEALRAAGVAPDDPAFSRALVFVDRCQNLPADPANGQHELPGGAAAPAFDDGGFHFIYDDPVRNKAGICGKDRAGRPRFASYGSTTADGLRCLRACGRPATDRSVVAARGWLAEHFDAPRHPGRYVEAHESNRQAVWFYYCASLSGALEAATPKGWAEALSAELALRQAEDGSWSNPAHAMREDDPMTATALALTALTGCLRAAALSPQR